MGERHRRRLASIALYALGCASAGTSTYAQTGASSALAAFELVRSVFQHPRCQNCHIPGDAPLQHDEGVPHAQLVKRGAQGHGATAMECQTCHGDANRPASYGDRAPPGAPNWHLPPPATPMVFIGLTPSDLCRAIKDRKSTGGKDLAAMHVHMREDKLVAWGWSPGGKRTVPPASQAEAAAAFKTWMDGGAPCPS